METNPTPTPPEGAPSAPLSLTERLTGVITAPGEVFGEIKDAPVRTANWLAPLILVCLATVVYICFAFSQPAILNGMKEQREKAMQKRVAAGTMTQAQADQASAMVEQYMGPTLMKIVGGDLRRLGIGGGPFSDGAGGLARPEMEYGRHARLHESGGGLRTGPGD
jgi:hypothetical protein